MKYIKQQEMGAFREKFLNKNDFMDVLATFCCYDYNTDASEVVEKIARDQKDHRKCSLYVTVCCIGKASNKSKKAWLLGYLRCS